MHTSAPAACRRPWKSAASGSRASGKSCSTSWTTPNATWTPGAILERAQKLDPRVHRVTVYRTLDLLKRNGLIDELDLLHLRGDQHFYESHGPRDHIHVACLKCGKVREFESELYEKLKKQIEKDCGIEITDDPHGSRRLLRKMQNIMR